MKKLFLSLAIFLYFLLPKNIFAAGEFSTTTNIYYTLLSSNLVDVAHYITLTNNTSEYYATQYELTLSGTAPQKIQAFSGDNPLETKVTTQGDETTISVKFSDTVVGINNKRDFNIRYLDSNIMTKHGEVSEVFIPRLKKDDDNNFYTVFLRVPDNLGKAAYISPKSEEEYREGDVTVYHFTNPSNIDSGISAAFGNFQVFDFRLIYHLENPLNKNSYFDIAVPPDTNFQKIVLDKMDPTPLYIYKDEDGNWLARYNFSPRERFDVEVVGSVQIYSQAYNNFEVTPEYLQKNLEAKEYWQVDDPKIQELARKLKTPKAIYDYVVNTLSYNYDRVKPNVVRLGAKESLTNPANAICMEFTDLFVALSRAAGIPAREINGYAYTENKELQPVSLVSDVLHSWAQYWDAERKVWVAVDPTWGNTTGGEDFFSKLDLRHFTFAIHGIDDKTPYPAGSYKLGAYPQKDVFVSFGKLPNLGETQTEIISDLQNANAFFGAKLNVLLKNKGKTSLFDQTLEIYFDGNKSFEKNIDYLTPFGEEKISVDIPQGFFSNKMPNSIEIKFAGKSQTIPTNKDRVIIGNTIGIFIILFVILLLSYAKLRNRKRLNKTTS